MTSSHDSDSGRNLVRNCKDDSVRNLVRNCKDDSVRNLVIRYAVPLDYKLTLMFSLSQSSINVTLNPNFVPPAEEQCAACSSASPVHVLVQQQEDLVKHVESLANMARDMEEEECKSEEWKLAAAVLDEFFFWLYLIMIVISKAVVFSMVPKYDD